MQHTPHHDSQVASSRRAGGMLTCLTAAHQSLRSHARQDWTQDQHARLKVTAEHLHHERENVQDSVCS